MVVAASAMLGWRVYLAMGVPVVAERAIGLGTLLASVFRDRLPAHRPAHLASSGTLAKSSDQRQARPARLVAVQTSHSRPINGEHTDTAAHHLGEKFARSVMRAPGAPQRASCNGWIIATDNVDQLTLAAPSRDSNRANNPVKDSAWPASR